MSTRILRFGKNQLSWCCLYTKASEAFPAGTPHGYDDMYKSFKGLTLRDKAQYRWNEDPRADHLPYDVWYWLVERFIGRSLTRNTDTLSALPGLAKEFQSLTRDKYCAGLWYNNLVEGLCWRRPKVVYVRASTTANPGKRPGISRAPSWSWAPLDTDVIYWHKGKDQEASVDIISCDTFSSGQNPFAEVSRGALRLQGYLIEANISPPDADQVESVNKLRLKDKEDKWFASMGADEQDFRIPDVWCIPIKKTPVYAGDEEDKSLYHTILSVVWYWFGQGQRRMNTVESGVSLQLQR
jgi:hypothetical protein